MHDFQLKTPVVFLVFNRPDTTEQVFKEIRRARPPKLFVIADGPRHDRNDEDKKCQAVRAIIDTVDWPCEVLKNYSNINLGCKRRVSSGIDWVFEKVEEAIFLEDDCLPHPNFFRYCEELLEKFRSDERIGMISGDNYLFDNKRSDASYYFSRYPHIWGWASWRRAWKHYDVNMKLWPQIRNTSFLIDLLDDYRSFLFWNHIFSSVYEGKIDTWDYQWVFACWERHYLSVTSSVNMVSNIGFGEEATHKQLKRFANMKSVGNEFPLYHLTNISRDSVADNYIETHNYSGTTKLWQLGLVYFKDLIRR